MILQNMSLTAVEEGLGHCDIYGATRALVQDKNLLARLQLPEGFTPTGSLALGRTTETYTDREIPETHKFELNRID
ncbi:MAG: nitroreductase family protein [Eubacterium sp.]|jgi:hypothetical protein|nr:nitroreductase family protein [Eubacterium sp.]MCH4046097.1 nitroreductase family protein [Eubacterium sp.]MCH4079192.1 nitroreductase family protein [Eubacterium sp.]MCH4110416.1 nitroreductase family protein [Eubacterium sp.]MCI1406240.1 nitroreductase family protein [Eubacterium sp.]